MPSNQLKKQLRYMGRQYQSGQVSRGGANEPHYLTQAADRIQVLEDTLNNLLNDCIDFYGGKLTDPIMEDARKALKA